MRTAIEAMLLIPLLGVVLPVCGYLSILTIAAPFTARPQPMPVRRLRRFAVLVPAHNEEWVLGRLLGSLEKLAYERTQVEICVVADNCTDATSAVARAHGALVFERHEPVQRGKGYALRWLLAELQRTERRYDAYVVLDADSVVAPNFLSAMNQRLESGARVLQGYYTVLPLHGTWVESLRTAALALVHYHRPAAKAALGASCGLKGNGMCFDRGVIERFGWPCAGLAEDVEFHLTLIAAGIRVEFVPEAVVRAEMPSSLAGARTQNLRWEAGRLATLRRQALPLLWRGVRRRDIAAIDAGLEQLLPPLSIPVFVALVTMLIGGLLESWIVWLAAALLMALALHVIAGLVMARAPARAYRALLFAPAYVGWKATLYARALLGRHHRQWIRTERMSAR